MELRTYIDDYITAMGTVGLWYLYEYGVNEGLISDPLVVRHRDYVVVSRKFLKLLPKLFFGYIFNATNRAKYAEQKLQNAKKIKTISEYVNATTKYLEEPKKKVNKNFTNSPNAIRINELFEELKTIKQGAQRDRAEQIVEECIEILCDPEINEKLTINYFRSSEFLAALYGQSSFLNVSHNGKSRDEMAEVFFKDYVKPVLDDLSIQDALESEDKKAFDQAIKNLNSSIPKKWKSLKKKKTIGEVKEVFENELRCSLLDGWYASGKFEEMYFMPLGVSCEKAKNYAWNFDDSQPIPLSSWAQLLLMLASVSLTRYHRVENATKNPKLFFGFVYTNGTVNDLIKANRDFQTLTQQGIPFGQIISQILRIDGERAYKRMANVFIVEFHSAGSKTKKTLMNYFDIPEHMARYLANKDNVESLSNIRDRTLRDNIIYTSMQNTDSAPHIQSSLRSTIASGGNGWDVYHAILERFKMDWYKRKRSDEEMAGEVKKISVLFNLGQSMRVAMIEGTKKREESDETYVAGGEKRINGIAYRLMNAANAGNKQQFFDSLLRLYMQADKPMSRIFLNILHEEYMDFPSVAYSFISGLLTPPQKTVENETSISQNATV